jgi:phage gpG-like protein
VGVTCTKELQRMIDRVSRFRTPQWRAGLSKNLAQEAQTQIVMGFAAQRDPYGRPWQPSRRAVSQGGQTLSDTARLRRSFSSPQAISRVDERGFEVGTNVLYAMAHQHGMTIRPKSKRVLAFKVNGRFVFAKKVVIPQRMMIPEGQLGPIWSSAFQRAASAYFRATT